jgi:hypothetical protein
MRFWMGFCAFDHQLQRLQDRLENHLVLGCVHVAYKLALTVLEHFLGQLGDEFGERMQRVVSD